MLTSQWGETSDKFLMLKKKKSKTEELKKERKKGSF